MNELIVDQWLKNYKNTPLKTRDALREILQQCALLGLARHNFFEHAAFYGGTALRILYGLDRFSEDLDFSLLQPNPNFDFSPFLKGLKMEMESFGFIVDVLPKRQEPPIFSAFVKTNTLTLLLNIQDAEELKGVHREELLTVKLEIDVNPPPLFSVESKLILNPVPFHVSSYILSDLFAGKLTAILYRAWKNRIKGRDWYDLIWFVKNNIPVNLIHLSARMHQGGHLDPQVQLTPEHLQQLLLDKIDRLDWPLAVQDIKAFIYDTEQLNLWGPSFFKQIVSRIQTIH